MSGSSAAEPSDPLLFMATYLEVAPRSAERGATLLRQERAATGGDEGLVTFDVLQRIDRPSQFVVLSAWTNDEALQAHRVMPHVAQLNADLMPLLVAPYDSRQHHGLTVGEASGPGQQGVCVVTHVDVVPQHKDNAVVALGHVAEGCRRQEGNIRFDVWQQTERGNHFTVVETWASDDAFAAHLMAPGTRAFRQALATMLGALYDERLYRALD